MPYKLYIKLAIGFATSAILCWMASLLRFPGDTIIARGPDTTLHDLIYFNSQNFVVLSGILCLLNLIYFVNALYPKESLVIRFRIFLVTIGLLWLSRCIWNLITYYIVTEWELLTDGVLLTGLLFYHTNKLIRDRNAANTRSTTLDH